jgi:hypothetical protein
LRTARPQWRRFIEAIAPLLVDWARPFALQSYAALPPNRVIARRAKGRRAASRGLSLDFAAHKPPHIIGQFVKK